MNRGGPASFAPTLLSLAALAAAALAPAVAAAAPKLRIAVVGLTSGKASAEVREKLDAAVAAGLAASGAEVVGAAETARRLAARGAGGCASAACLAGVAQEAGARYVVRGSVELDGRSYLLRLEMLDGASGGGVIESREDRCEICTEAEAYETASVSASALKAAVAKRLAVADAAGAAPPAPPPAASPPPVAPAHGSAPAPTVSTTAAPERAPRSRVLPLVAIGAGVAGVVTGVVLLSIDGEGTCSHAPGDLCERRYRTKTSGLAFTGVGGVLAALGVVFLVGRF